MTPLQMEAAAEAAEERNRDPDSPAAEDEARGDDR